MGAVRQGRCAPRCTGKTHSKPLVRELPRASSMAVLLTPGLVVDTDRVLGDGHGESVPLRVRAGRGSGGLIRSEGETTPHRFGVIEPRHRAAGRLHLRLHGGDGRRCIGAARAAANLGSDRARREPARHWPFDGLCRMRPQLHLHRPAELRLHVRQRRQVHARVHGREHVRAHVRSRQPMRDRLLRRIQLRSRLRRGRFHLYVRVQRRGEMQRHVCEAKHLRSPLPPALRRRLR